MAAAAADPLHLLVPEEEERVRRRLDRLGVDQPPAPQKQHPPPVDQ